MFEIFNGWADVKSVSRIAQSNSSSMLHQCGVMEYSKKHLW